MSAAAAARKTPATDRAATGKARRERQLVHEVAQRHFGEKARKVVERGGGLTNAVYQFTVAQGDFIVRSHRDATKIGDYLKERWAMDAARAVGVPTPRVLEVGNFADGRPYMIAEQVRGLEGRHARDRLAVLEQLGRAAALIHGVRTHGFGTVFESGNQLSRHASWADWLANGFGVERRIATLLRHRAIDPPHARRLRRTAAEIARWRKPAALHHGDLRLKNAIVDPESGRLAALLDWDNAASSPAPYWDLSLALHDLGVDEKEAFLAGYGIKPRALAAALPSLRFFNVLNYVSAVEQAAAKKDEARLERFRLRLLGGLDLYAGIAP